MKLRFQQAWIWGSISNSQSLKATILEGRRTDWTTCQSESNPFGAIHRNSFWSYSFYEDFRPFKFQVSLGFFEILECRLVVFPILLGFRWNWRSFSQDPFKKLWWTKDCTQNCNNFKTQTYRSQFISDFLRCLNITVVCFVYLPETIK